MKNILVNDFREYLPKWNEATKNQKRNIVNLYFMKGFNAFLNGIRIIGKVVVVIALILIIIYLLLPIINYYFFDYFQNEKLITLLSKMKINKIEYSELISYTSAIIINTGVITFAYNTYKLNITRHKHENKSKIIFEKNSSIKIRIWKKNNQGNYLSLFSSLDSEYYKNHNLPEKTYIKEIILFFKNYETEERYGYFALNDSDFTYRGMNNFRCIFTDRNETNLDNLCKYLKTMSEKKDLIVEVKWNIRCSYNKVKSEERMLLYTQIENSRDEGEYYDFNLKILDEIYE